MNFLSRLGNLSINSWLLSFIVICRRYDDDPDKIWNCGAWFEYILVVVVSSLLLLAATVLTLFWAIYYRQGFDLTDADKKFNLHPVLMIGGYITLSGFCKYTYLKLCFEKPFHSSHNLNDKIVNKNDWYTYRIQCQYQGCQLWNFQRAKCIFKLG